MPNGFPIIPSITEYKFMNLWGIHGGAYGEVEEIFLEQNVIAIGWPQIGNLEEYRSRDDITQAIRSAYRDKTVYSARMNAGVLYRFKQEVQNNDLVIFPSKTDRHIYYGLVIKSYEYLPNLSQEFPNVRRVKWLFKIHRDWIDAKTLYVLNAQATLFNISSHRERFLSIFIRGLIQLITQSD